MAAEPSRGFRGFFRSTAGRVVLLLIGIGAVFGTFAYVATLIAIPVMLIVGLALPIWLGLKRPRYLALSALVVLLVVAPLATVVFTQELLVPSPAASSSPVAPFGAGGSVLQNANVGPFIGTAGTTFTWNVTLEPKYLPARLNGTAWTGVTLYLYISTCPGAVNPNSTLCSAGYPLIPVAHAFSAPPVNGSVVTFTYRIGTNGIWDWQMVLQISNATNKTNPARILLVGDPTYNGIEGPIVGGFATVYGALILAIYLDELVYIGIPFYFILLLYVWYKNRQRRHREAVKRGAQALQARQAGTAGDGGAPALPSGGAPPAGSAPPSATAAVASSEATCPSCGAVVYPNEAKCWKCGAALPATSGPSAPARPAG